METAIPQMLREAMSDFGMHAVDAWWSGLDEPARNEVISLWNEASRDGQCTVRVNGRIVTNDAEQDDPELWHNDFYDYLVNHELRFAEPRVFHICTQQPEARAAVSAGFIPGNFSCPVHEQDCPMRTILNFTNDRPVRLRIAFVPSGANERM